MLLTELEENYPPEVWYREAECIYTRACYGRKYTVEDAIFDARELEDKSPVGAEYLRWLLERRRRYASKYIPGVEWS